MINKTKTAKEGAKGAGVESPQEQEQEQQRWENVNNICMYLFTERESREKH